MPDDLMDGVMVDEILFSGPVRSIPIAATGANMPIVKRKAELVGWSFVETTGAASAAVDIIDGGDANGAPIATITLNASESVRDTIGSPGILAKSGVFLKVVSGSVRGAVWLRL